MKEIKIRAEINERENRKTLDEINFEKLALWGKKKKLTDFNLN